MKDERKPRMERGKTKTVKEGRRDGREVKGGGREEDGKYRV